MCEGFACIKVCAPCACLIPLEVRKGYQMPWNRSHKWLWATMWILIIGPGSFVKTRSTLNYWAISLAPIFSLLFLCSRRRPLQKVINSQDEQLDVRCSAPISLYNITYIAKVHGTLQKRVSMHGVRCEDSKGQRPRMSDVRLCLLSVIRKVYPMTTWLPKQDLNKSNNSWHSITNGEISWTLGLDKELQVISKCWERENSSSTGMSSLFGDLILNVNLRNGDTRQHLKGPIRLYLYGYFIYMSM